MAGRKQAVTTWGWLAFNRTLRAMLKAARQARA